MENQLTPLHIKEETGTSPLELLSEIFKYWKLIVICSLIGLGVAYIVNLYTVKLYRLSTKIHIKEKENPLTNSNVSLAFNWGGSSNLVQAHIAILGSYTHNYNVAKRLGWEVEYFKKGNFYNENIYKNRNYDIIFDTNYNQLTNSKINITLKENLIIIKINSETENIKTFNFKTEKEEIFFEKKINFNKKIKYNKWVKSKYFKFKITSKRKINLKKQQTENLYFKFVSYKEHAKKMSAMVNIEELGRASTILEISGISATKEKLQDYLNTTVKTLQYFEISKKNQMATNTIKFINKQSKIISDSLDNAELNLHLFRTKHEVFDISFEAEKLFELYIELEKQRTELLNQKKYFNYTKKYLKENKDLDDFLTPNITTVTDPVFTKLIEHLTLLNLERNKFQFSMEKINPAIQENENQIFKTKKTILINVEQLIKNINVQIGQVYSHIAELKQKLSSFPYTQQQLINLNRIYTLYNEQYTFLLRRKSEIAITKSSSTPDSKIIDPAINLNKSPITPNKPKNYLLGFLVGVLIPIGFVILKKILNKKITSQKDLEKITDISIIGKINSSIYNHNLIVLKKPQSSVSESFRTIRANLQFYLKEKDSNHNIITITSSVGGEGKTFCAINIASILALSNVKTVLVGVDLRKPKIFNDFNLPNEKGVTNYLINKAELKEIIQPTNFKNLDIISSGPIPPNPSELIMTNKFNKLLNELKEKYNYIILDTAPVGLVADTLEILKKSDIGLYIVRENYTKDYFLNFINEQYKNKSVKNISILLNDTKHEKRYGYGYYEEDK